MKQDLYQLKKSMCRDIEDAKELWTRPLPQWNRTCTSWKRACVVTSRMRRNSEPDRCFNETGPVPAEKEHVSWYRGCEGTL